MLVYLSCAKLMSSAPVGRVEGAGDPLFQAQAERHVLNLMSLTIDDWSEQLHIKREMAAEVWHMYQHFLSGRQISAFRQPLHTMAWFSVSFRCPL